jgi:hypothetical protein
MANDQTSDKDKELRLHDAFDDLCRLIFRLVTQNPGSEESKIKIIKQYIEAIDDFATTFSKGTSGDNSFLSLSEIEYLVLSLQGKHRILSQELVHEKMRELVEKRLLEKKNKTSSKKKG